MHQAQRDPAAHPALWSAMLDDLAQTEADLDATLRRLARRTAQALEAAVTVFLLTPDGLLEPRAVWSDDPGRRREINALLARGNAPITEGIVAKVAATRAPVVVARGEPVTDDLLPPLYSGWVADSGLHSFLILPLVTDDVLHGVLVVARYGAEPDARDALGSATRIASVAAHVIRIATMGQRQQLADAALSAMREAVVAVDERGTITYWNAGARELYGRPAGDVVGRSVSEVLAGTRHGETSPVEWPELLRVLTAGGGAVGLVDQTSPSTPLGDRGGRRIVTDWVVSPIGGASGHGDGAVIVIRDVTREIEIDTRLTQQRVLAQAALDSSPMLTAVLDVAGTVVAASRGWTDRLGPDSGVGARLADIVAALVPDADARAALLASFAAVAGGEVPRTQSDYEVRGPDGDRTFSVHVTGAPRVGATITIADITDRASRERALFHSATHDTVTRLPNRAVLLDRGVHALDRAGRQRAQIGLLFCDLDGFKELNDRYGHGTGDDVLEFFGARLMESCRSSDTVARIGGDEFAILIEDSVDESTVSQVAHRVVAAAAEPLRVPAGDMSVTTSVGAIVVKAEPDRHYDAADVEALLHKADAAMYEAKRRGKNRWVLFDDALEADHASRTALVGDLVRGTSFGQFLLHFQPQFDGGDLLRGAEALLRWKHPVRGVIEPFDFVAHEGLPAALGDWIMGQVVATLIAWQPYVPAGFRMGLNLSRDQWLDSGSTDVLMDWLDRTGAPPGLLRVEIPQDAIAVDLDHAAALTHRYAAAGIDVALNGFGTGTAPLADLTRLSIQTIALGRRVVRDITDPASAALLHGIATMGRAMGWRVIATGVENEPQLAAVRAAGCDLAQGYLLGRAIPADAFEAEYL